MGINVFIAVDQRAVEVEEDKLCRHDNNSWWAIRPSRMPNQLPRRLRLQESQGPKKGAPKGTPSNGCTSATQEIVLKPKSLMRRPGSPGATKLVRGGRDTGQRMRVLPQRKLR